MKLWHGIDAFSVELVEIAVYLGAQFVFPALPS